MSADEGVRPELQTTDSPDLEAPQRRVFDRFHDPDYGRVCVNAGAGTGKTMTMIRTVAQAIVAEDATGTDPFEEILLTTFSNDAAHELKTRLKAQLREHDEAAPKPLNDAVWRNIETNADIGTIDGYFHDLLQEIAVDLSIPLDFDVRETVTEIDLLDEIFGQVRATHPAELRLLRDTYPPTGDTNGASDHRELIFQAHQKCREYCWTPAQATRILHDSLEEMHANHGRPADVDDVQAILNDLVPNPPNLQSNDDTTLAQLLVHVQETYDESKEVIDAFGTVLGAFEEHYDRITREEGALSHTDITYLLVRELEGDEHDLAQTLDTDVANKWRRSLSDRYTYVFIDEFQDTSFAQCRVLSHLLTEETQVLLIGDVKQSIYEWRSAEPELFGDIIDVAQRNDSLRDVDEDPKVEPDHLDIPGLTHVPLTLNFRSHPDIIDAANRLFSHVFSEESLGAMGDIDIDYQPLDAFRDRTQPTRPRVHAMDFSGNTTRDEWVRGETHRIADIITTILESSDENGSVRVDPYTKSSIDEPAPPDPGDITLLFRARSRMEEYAQTLRQRGIRVAVDSSDDLFKTTEIKLIIDVLEWFANPHSRPSLLRILRSPLVAVSDETLRTLTRFDGRIQKLLDNWPPKLPAEDRDRIEGLVELRDDLRWSREEAKSDLVHKILRHSGFEAVLLANPEAIREYGNIWMLTEIIDQWEEEELLAYRELVDRLTTLRDLSSGTQPDFTVAPIASEENSDAVIMTTVHASKGREFPIVFLVDLLNRLNFPRTQLDRLVYSRRDGMALRPTPGDADFPDNVTLGGPDADDRWLSEDRSDGPISTATGPIWLSDKRAGNGHFAYSNTLNRHLEREVAEQWRNLYVAFTRAADHIFFGLCNESIYRGEYTTWMAPMRNVFAPDELNPGVFGHPLDELDDDEMTPTDSILPGAFAFGVDDIDLQSGRQRAQETPELPDTDSFLAGDPPGEPVEPLPFRPRSLTATAVHDLLSCPRRYQYEHIQDISQIAQTRTDSIEPPGNVAPTEWGTAVHEALEAHVHPEFDIDPVLGGIRQQLGTDVVDVITDTILPYFGSTTTARQLETIDDNQIYTEETFEVSYDIDSTEVLIRGTADLLFNDDGDWHLVDYKTGDVHPPGTYDSERYETQLQAYAWLVKELYDIEVSHAELIYVHAEQRREIAVSSDEFETTLGQIVDRLQLVEDNDGRTVLETDPDPSPDAEPNRATLEEGTRCGSCPYGASKGGPCDFG